MRILVINYEYPPIGGGGGLVTRDIYEKVTEYGHHVTIITSHVLGLEEYEIINNVEIIRTPILFRKRAEVASIPSMLCYFPSSLLGACRRIRCPSYDIMNTHFAIPSGPTGWVLSRVYGLRNVLTLHGGDIFDPSKSLSPHRTPLLRSAVKFILNHAEVVVAQSNDTRKNAYQYYKLDREIEIIPLGIKRPLFKKKHRPEFDIDPKDIVFCTIGRLIKRKNIDDALAILSVLKDRFFVKLFIIGDGPERPRLEELTRRLRVEGYVHFLGNVPDETKFQLLDLSDCYLSTALHEGFGLVFLEAMECGIPILCYDRGGQNDFLVNGKSGFLVPLNDKRVFCEKLIQLAKNAQLRKNMGSFNKNLVKDYTVDTCADRYVRLFERVISQDAKRKNQDRLRP